MQATSFSLIPWQFLPDIEAEQGLVAANRELITGFEQKIQASLARIWGEEDN
jgi:type I restriction enzyme M protein